MDRQPGCITGLVVRTRNVDLTAAVVVACRVLGRFFPGAAPGVTMDRIAIGEQPWERDAMQELVSRIRNMWVAWGEVAGPDDSWGRLADTFAGGRQVTLRAPDDPAVAAQAAARFLDMVRVEEPDWGDDPAVEINPEIPVPLPRPPGPARQGCVRLGVDLGGVLFAKMPARQLRTVRTANDIGIKMGCAPGAEQWLAECVRAYGPENVWVVSYVQSDRLRDLFARFLFAPDGLLQTARIPGANLVWTNSRSDKCRPFVEKNLTHFIDDQVEVLVSIRNACWERRQERPPPALFLVPTVWADGSRGDFERTRSDALGASGADWRPAWHIFPQTSVAQVRPWHPDWATGGGGGGALSQLFNTRGKKKRLRLRLSESCASV